MVRREADRSGVFGQVVETQGLRILNQRAEDAAPAGEVPDGGLRLLVDARDDELLERLPARVDDAQRGVPGPGQLSSRLDDPLQDRVERQLRRECDTRVHDGSQTIHLGHAG